MNQKTIYKDIKNERVWNDDEVDVYTFKTTYKKLEDSCQGKQTKLFKLFWKVKALPSAQHLAWRVLLDKVSTMKILCYRGSGGGGRKQLMCHV